MRLALLVLILSSCGPVLLGEEERELDAGGSRPNQAGTKSEPSMPAGPAGPADPADAATPRDAGTSVAVTVHIKALDCGRCFDLQAVASGGRPPYQFEWDDGTRNASRRVCVQGGGGSVASVIAQDASAARSAAQTVYLQGAMDAGCEPPSMPVEPEPAPKLCLMNLSLEGTPAVNFGQAQAFDAEPWSTCTYPAETNIPNISNASVAQTLGPIPEPTDGVTFLTLGEGQQVSQALCSEFPSDATVSLELDLTRLNVGAGIVPETEQVFLEIWGGLEVDCSRRELLWLSPKLEANWKRFCVTMRPRSYMTQLTLRATADMSLSLPAYLAVDNLKLVDSCP